MSFSVDSSEVSQLAADIAAGQRKTETEMRRVVFRGAMNVKRDWRSNVSATAGRRARAYAGSIGFDLDNGDVTATVEAKGGGSTFGAILEYGTATSPPHNDAKRALDKEQPNFVKAVEKVAREFLK